MRFIHSISYHLRTPSFNTVWDTIQIYLSKASAILLISSLVLALFQWETLLYSNTEALSLGIDAIWTRSYLPISEITLLLFFFCYFSTVSITSKYTLPRYVLLSFAGTCLGIVLSYFFSLDPWLHILKARHILEGMLLFYIVYQDSQLRRLTVYTFAASALAESVLMILQFCNNGSLGLAIIKEPILSPFDLTTAKFHFMGMNHIRSYGTFLHPNIAAGYLLLSIFLIYKQKYLFSAIKNWQFYSLLAVIICGILCSFSKTAFFILGSILILWLVFKSTYFNNLYHTLYEKISVLQIIKKDILRVVWAFNLLFLLSVLILGSIFFFFDSSTITDRILLLSSSFITFVHHPFGVGLGSFVLSLNYPTLPLFFPWEYQPVHSFYILTLVELGIIGGVSYSFLFFSLMYLRIKEWYQTHSFSWSQLGIILTFLAFAVIDHFWLTSFVMLLILMSSMASLIQDIE